MLYPDEYNSNPSGNCSSRQGEISIVVADDTSHHDMRDHHTEGASHKEDTSSKSIDEEDGRECRDEIYDSKNASCQ